MRRKLSSGVGLGETFRALEACRARGNDLTDAMSFSPDQAVCQIDEDCGSSHAVHHFDVLKGRLAAVLWLPVAHTTTCFIQCSKSRSPGMHMHCCSWYGVVDILCLLHCSCDTRQSDVGKMCSYADASFAKAHDDSGSLHTTLLMTLSAALMSCSPSSSML